jgi:hypothetical protein
MSTLRIFANGVLAPNNKAENKAATMEARELVTTVGSCLDRDYSDHAGKARLGPRATAASTPPAIQVYTGARCDL